MADLRSGGCERITVADFLCMRSGLARWANDERGLLWRSDRARYVFDRPVAAMPGSRFNYNGGLTAVSGLLARSEVPGCRPRFGPASRRFG